MVLKDETFAYLFAEINKNRLVYQYCPLYISALSKNVFGLSFLPTILFSFKIGLIKAY